MDAEVPSTELDRSLYDTPPLEGTRIVQDFVLHLDPLAQKITIESASQAAPGLSPQNIGPLPLEQDGVPGVGQEGTVELVTDQNSIRFDEGNQGLCAGPAVRKFCADVTLRHFFPYRITNAHVQVTAITDENGTPITGHGGINGDPSIFGFNAALGFWKYTSPAASPGSGTLLKAPNNYGLRNWVFANPDDRPTNINLRVIGTIPYRDYSFTPFTPPAYLNACKIPNGVNAGRPTNWSINVQIPFPFTLYNVTSTRVNFNRNGVFTLGSVALPGGNNVNLPDNGFFPTAPSPAAFPFWDALNYNGYSASTSSLCHALVGSAPKRKFVITWNNMRIFGNTDNSNNFLFSTVLNEGSDTIEVHFIDMKGKSKQDRNRASGSSATLGLQGNAESGSLRVSSPAPARVGQTDTSTTNGPRAYLWTPVP